MRENDLKNGLTGSTKKIGIILKKTLTTAVVRCVLSDFS
jgi:hypothetical protein